MEKVEYYEMDYDEFEELIMSKYPYIEQYEYVPCEESGNDTSHTYRNITAENWDKYDDEQWEVDIVQEKNYDFASEIFLKKLCKDGHIPPGNYLIDVCW